MNNFSLLSSLKDYFSERAKLEKIDGWVGKSTASDSLTPIYMALRALKQETQIILKNKNIQWSIQTSIGQGFATPDHYMALLPFGQKVSNGIYFCFCFDRTGTGCVMGAMTSIQTNQRVDEKTLVRARPIGNDKKNMSWEILSPHSVNVWGRNNAFFNPQELTFEQISQDAAQAQDKIIAHIEQSKKLIELLISQRKTLF